MPWTYHCDMGVDPFSDVYHALIVGRIHAHALVHWLEEWASYGAQHDCMCHANEVTSVWCQAASAVGYALAGMLQILVY